MNKFKPNYKASSKLNYVTVSQEQIPSLNSNIIRLCDQLYKPKIIIVCDLFF